MLQLTSHESATSALYAKQGRNFVLPTQRQPKEGIWLSRGDT
jgi:hypothetical protein